jgi:hypothetical protein
MKYFVTLLSLAALLSSCKVKKASCEAYGENTYPAKKIISKSK